jgi:rhomboid family GlyGly-CTERM serine protease
MTVAAARNEACRPVATLLVAAAGLAVFLSPAATQWLIYDRDRVLAGQVWRLLTGNVVHLSASHLLYNLVVFVAAGIWIERSQRPAYLLLISLTATASGLYFLTVMPQMARYGGLSGVVSAIIVYLSLQEIGQGGISRVVWTTVLALFTAKVGYEILFGQAVFAVSASTPFEVVPVAHIIGAIAAIVLFRAAARRVRSVPGLHGCSYSIKTRRTRSEV